MRRETLFAEGALARLGRVCEHFRRAAHADHHCGRQRRSGNGGRPSATRHHPHLAATAATTPSHMHPHHFTTAVTVALEHTRRNAPAELVHDVRRTTTVFVVVDAAVTAVVVPADSRMAKW